MFQLFRARVAHSGAAVAIAAAVLTVSALALPIRGLAAGVTWTGAAGTDKWSTPGNWSTGSVPSAADDVTFLAPTGSSVLLDDLGSGSAPWHSATFVGSWTLTFAPTLFPEIHFPIVLSTATTTLTVDVAGTWDVSFYADISGPGNRVITGTPTAQGVKDHVPMTYTGTTTIQSPAWLGVRDVTPRPRCRGWRPPVRVHRNCLWRPNRRKERRTVDVGDRQ